MNTTAKLRRHLAWLPRLSLLLVVVTVATGLLNSRSVAREPSPCGTRLGQMPAPGDQALSGHVDILSWNIQKASNAGWAKDLAQMSEGIHLAFLQEAAIQADIPATFGGRDIYQSFTQGYSTETMQSGVMTLSSGSPTLLCQFHSVEPWLGTPKTATVTEHPLAGRQDRLLTINLHAVNFTFGLGGLEAQLQPLAALLAQHTGPVILAGDFNTWSRPRQRLVDDIFGTHGLEPVGFSDDLRTRVFGLPLDHIYTRGLDVEYTEVVPVASSDHNALRARLVIP